MMSFQTPLNDVEVPSPGVRTGWSDGLGQFVACDSLHAFGAWLEHTAPTVKKADKNGHHVNGDCGAHKTVSRSTGWTGLPAEMHGKGRLHLAQNLASVTPTFDDGAKKATEDALPDAVRAEIVAHFRWSMNAGSMSMDRLFGGRQDFMRRRRSVRKEHRVVAIGVQINANANINTETLRIRGVVAAIAADVLESMGIRCEVWALTHGVGVFTRSGAKSNGTFATRIKSADEPMIEGQVFNGLSSWMFRELVFAARCAQDPTAVKGSMGSSRVLNEEQAHELTAMMGVDDVAFLNVVPHTNNRESAIKDAVKRLLEVLTAQGAFA